MYLCMLLLFVKIIKQHHAAAIDRKVEAVLAEDFFPSVSMLRGKKKRKETRLVEDRDYYVNIY